MKSNPISHYVKWILQQFNALHNAKPQSYTYKIIDKKSCTKTGEEKLFIQVAGKNAFFQITPAELVKDEATLRGFSPLDVRTITYLACHAEKPKAEKKSLYRIIAQFFSKNKKSEMITLQADNSLVQITKSAQEISNDPILINHIEPADAHRIGYITGVEQTSLEENLLRDLKVQIDTEGYTNGK